ncbi:MAG: hypothetical protein KHX99_07190 [Atopobium sp.]|nr:hypothetical protein [Atopobium sp.]
METRETRYGWPMLPDWQAKELQGVLLMLEHMRKDALLRNEIQAAHDFAEVAAQIAGLLPQE